MPLLMENNLNAVLIIILKDVREIMITKKFYKIWILKKYYTMFLNEQKEYKK